MKKIKGNTIKGLDTGKMLRAILKKHNLNKTQVGRRTGRTESTIAAMLKQTTIQVYVLWELSLALKHNFFADLAEQLTAAAPAGTLDNAQQPLTAQLAALEKENEQLRSERDLLKKVIEVLGKE